MYKHFSTLELHFLYEGITESINRWNRQTFHSDSHEAKKLELLTKAKDMETAIFEELISRPDQIPWVYFP